ncbi:MAG: sigma-70 family RNA polymerase sigma factor [Blastocatellales bacterium]
MTPPNSGNVTQLLVDWRNGNDDALNQLMPLVYDELRGLAKRYMSRERSTHTLQTNALVNEAYLRLINQQDVDWQNRAHFFAIAAQVMRNLLVDHARSKQYAKRGGGAQQITLDEGLAVASEQSVDVLALHEALERLAEVDERKSRIVELRYFGGLSAEETAEVLGVSEITIKREWLKAKAWLFRELSQTDVTLAE